MNICMERFLASAIWIQVHKRVEPSGLCVCISRPRSMYTVATHLLPHRLVVYPAAYVKSKEYIRYIYVRQYSRELMPQAVGAEGSVHTYSSGNIYIYHSYP